MQGTGGTYIQLGIFLKGGGELVFGEPLRQDTLANTSHAERVVLVITDGGSTTLPQSANQSVNLAAGGMIGTGLAIIVQGGLADLDETKRFVNVFAHHLLAEAQASQSL